MTGSGLYVFVEVVGFGWGGVDLPTLVEVEFGSDNKEHISK